MERQIDKAIEVENHATCQRLEREEELNHIEEEELQRALQERKKQAKEEKKRHEAEQRTKFRSGSSRANTEIETSTQMLATKKNMINITNSSPKTDKRSQGGGGARELKRTRES